MNRTEEFIFNKLKYKVLSSEDCTVEIIGVAEENTSGCLKIDAQILVDSVNYTVVAIGEYAFEGCNWNAVSIPPTIKYIGDDAFLDCEELGSIYISDLTAWCNIEFGNYYLRMFRPEYKLFLNEKEATDIVIPETVSKIGDFAFYGCSSIESVVIPSAVTEIGAYAFEGCIGIKSVVIPSSVSKIGDFAFAGCQRLKSILIPESVIKIGASSFSGCKELEKLEIFCSLAEIGHTPFYSCKRIKTIICHLQEPPNCKNLLDDDINMQTVIYIPSGCKDKYRNSSPWNKFKNIVEIEMND